MSAVMDRPKVKLRPMVELTHEHGMVLIAFGPECWITSTLENIEACERGNPGHKLAIIGWTPVPQLEVCE